MEKEPTPCVYQPACPGCPRFSQDSLDVDQVERLRALAKAWGAAPPGLISAPAKGYRHRVRLSVRGTPGKLQIGIFEARSHRLVHIPRCPLHHSSIERFIETLLDCDQAEGISPYNESSHTGLLRALQLAVEPASGRVQAVLLIRDPLAPGHQVASLLEPLLQKLKACSWVHSLYLGALPERTNSLQCAHYELLWGAAQLVDECGGARAFYPPGAFGQANPLLHNQAVDRIHDFVEAGRPVTEYYAGVGTIGLGLKKRGLALRFNEVAGGSLDGLRLGLRDLGIDASPNVVLEGKAGDFTEVYDPGGTVIVDPPRKGLDSALLTRLLEEPPQRLIYLSCGLDSLLREMEIFRADGKTRLSHIEAFAYFPFTKHVESLLVLDRKDNL